MLLLVYKDEKVHLPGELHHSLASKHPVHVHQEHHQAGALYHNSLILSCEEVIKHVLTMVML